MDAIPNMLCNNVKDIQYIGNEIVMYCVYVRVSTSAQLTATNNAAYTTVIIMKVIPLAL